jgi:hypothetical protein
MPRAQILATAPSFVHFVTWEFLSSAMLSEPRYRLRQRNVSVDAFEGLIGATRAVREVITERKADLVELIADRGVLAEFDRYIESAPQRAV